MHIKLFSVLPSLKDYEVKFSRWHFMAFQFLNVNALLKYSVLRKFASSMYLQIEARVIGIIAKKVLKLKTAFLMPSPS